MKLGTFIKMFLCLREIISWKDFFVVAQKDHEKDEEVRWHCWFQSQDVAICHGEADGRQVTVFFSLVVPEILAPSTDRWYRFGYRHRAALVWEGRKRAATCALPRGVYLGSERDAGLVLAFALQMKKKSGCFSFSTGAMGRILRRKSSLLPMRHPRSVLGRFRLGEALHALST